ncbi:hypothetical protein NDU88_001680 [Pleurodeles waltl]|uniref:Uncharacterized protein n=1 Tax=Pleurodeles waltl TaxID=8319 RepID=A0AAV7KWV4_PLEWA|nr:hypothetical protein NDU88_001680 [Pleurodeles waltl]
MGAAPDAWDSDFRVPGDVKEDDGLKEGAEESSDATDARGRDREPEDAVPAAGGEETGKPELPKARTRLEERSSQQETSAFRHIPGGTWLNNVRSLFQGQTRLLKTGNGARKAGREGEVVERGIDERG